MDTDAPRAERGNGMLDTRTVLAVQAILYTIYVLAIFSLMVWFAIRVTTTTAETSVRPAVFYTYVSILVVVGVSLHLFTHFVMPWKELDLAGTSVEADRTFNIEVAQHRFTLPEKQLIIKEGEIVRFNLISRDLTYGFGLFRPDNSMLFQMQVVPGHANQIAWEFTTPGTYTIRSTEYSGPKGVDMMVKDAIVVTK
jgi:cytochrome c oxidase subunit 2